MWKPTMATRLLLSLLLLLLVAMSTVGGAAAARAGASPSWCVCRPEASDAALQSTLDYACGNGGDCGPLHSGEPCHDPDTLLAHCSYAANSYFHSDKDAACDFAGTAALSSTDPSSGTCKYPATDDAKSIPLWFLLIVLALCVISISLCLAESACGSSSTRANVSGGAAVKEETSTAEAATEAERPVTSTCPVCLDTWTNLGPHRSCCIPCGHVYGRSCLERWLTQCGNSGARCPECRSSFQRKDIIDLYNYGPEVSV